MRLVVIKLSGPLAKGVKQNLFDAFASSIEKNPIVAVIGLLVLVSRRTVRVEPCVRGALQAFENEAGVGVVQFKSIRRDFPELAFQNCSRFLKWAALEREMPTPVALTIWISLRS